MYLSSSVYSRSSESVYISEVAEETSEAELITLLLCNPQLELSESPFSYFTKCPLFKSVLATWTAFWQS